MIRVMFSGVTVQMSFPLPAADLRNCIMPRGMALMKASTAKKSSRAKPLPTM